MPKRRTEEKQVDRAEKRRACSVERLLRLSLGLTQRPEIRNHFPVSPAVAVYTLQFLVDQDAVEEICWSPITPAETLQASATDIGSGAEEAPAPQPSTEHNACVRNPPGIRPWRLGEWTDQPLPRGMAKPLPSKPSQTG